MPIVGFIIVILIVAYVIVIPKEKDVEKRLGNR